MLEIRALETGSDAGMVAESLPVLESLPLFDFHVRPIINRQVVDWNEEIESKIKSGKSAYLRALAHHTEDNLPDAEIDLQNAYAHFGYAISLIESVGGTENAADLATSYGFRGVLGLVWNVSVNNRFPLDLAIGDLQKSCELRPLAETYIVLSVAHLQNGKSDDALLNLKKACEIDHRCADAYLLRGLIHYQSGDADKAHNNIYKAVRLNASLYREEFEPIMAAERNMDAAWDELLSRPEADAAFKEAEDEARAILQAMQ